MIPRPTITRALRKKYEQDWLAEFPAIKLVEARHLGRIVGPIFQGVLLERDSSYDNYTPYIHVTDLTKTVPPIALFLQMKQFVPTRTGMPEQITVRKHEEKYQLMANRLASESLLPVAGPWRIGMVERAVQLFLDRLGYFSIEHLQFSREIVVRSRSWLGDSETASKLAASSIAEARLARKDHNLDWGDRQAEWAENLLTAAANPDLVRQTVSNNIDALGLQKLPYSELTL